MSERVALVTGAASGIGAAITDRLRADGWRVLTVDVRGDVDHVADLTSRSGNRESVAAAVADFGRLDAVVPSAGLQHVAPVEEFPEDRWDELIALLLTSPFLLAREGVAAPARVRRRPLLRDRLGARARRVAVQGGLRRGQARRPRAGEDACARGRDGRDQRNRRVPRLRAHAARRGAARRSGSRRTGRDEEQGARGRHPRAARDQAPDRARGGGRRPSRSCSAPPAPRSPASRSRWTRDGPPRRRAPPARRPRLLDSTT